MARPLGHKPRRRSERGNKGGLQLAPHKRQNVTKRENGVDRLGGSQLRGARSNQSTRPAKSKPVRGSHNKPRVRTPRERQGRSQSELNPWRELEDPTSWEPQKFPRGTAPLDPTVIHRQIQRSKKSQLSDRDSAEATDLNRNGVIETHPTRGEETITSR